MNYLVVSVPYHTIPYHVRWMQMDEYGEIFFFIRHFQMSEHARNGGCLQQSQVGVACSAHWTAQCALKQETAGRYHSQPRKMDQFFGSSDAILCESVPPIVAHVIPTSPDNRQQYCINTCVLIIVQSHPVLFYL